MSSPRELDARLFTRLKVERPSAASIAAAQTFGSATLHEAAGKRGALPAAIKPITAGLKVCGPAITVHSPGGDNLWLHRAIYAAQPGDVLVVYCNGRHEHGYWGEIMSTAARARNLGGLVIDGCVRDHALLQQIKFPVFARGLCIRGTDKDFAARGWINHPILLDDVIVEAGDLIVGDEDGVVSISRPRVDAVVNASRMRESREAEIIRALSAGASTLDLYGWARDAD